MKTQTSSRRPRPRREGGGVVTPSDLIAVTAFIVFVVALTTAWWFWGVDP